MAEDEPASGRREHVLHVALQPPLLARQRRIGGGLPDGEDLHVDPEPAQRVDLPVDERGRDEWVRSDHVADAHRTSQSLGSGAG